MIGILKIGIKCDWYHHVLLKVVHIENECSTDLFITEVYMSMACSIHHKANDTCTIYLEVFWKSSHISVSLVKMRFVRYEQCTFNIHISYSVKETVIRIGDSSHKPTMYHTMQAHNSTNDQNQFCHSSNKKFHQSLLSM